VNPTAPSVAAGSDGEGRCSTGGWVRLRLGRHLSAFAATAVSLLAGIWLLVAPWVLDYPQPSGGWGRPTLIDFWTGVGVVAVSSATLILYAATLSGAMRRMGVVPAQTRAARRQHRADGRRAGRGRSGTPAPEAATPSGRVAPGAVAVPPGAVRSAPEPAPAGGPPASVAAAAPDPASPPASVDDVLVPLATALLADLVRRRMADAGDGPTAAQGGR